MYVDNNDAFNYAMNCFNNTPILYVDTETTGLNSFKGARICGISIASETEEFYFPFRHALGFNWFIDEKMPIFRELLSSKPCVGWNYKFDLHMLHADGVPFNEQCYDVQLAAHLMDENEECFFRLKEIANKYLGDNSNIAEQQLQAKLLTHGYGKADMWRLDGSEVSPYACDDVRLTRELLKFYTEPMKVWGVFDIWLEICKYMFITTLMENRGIMINPNECYFHMEDAEVKAKEILKKLEIAAGYPINPNSPKQVVAWLGTPDSQKKTLELLEDSNANAKLIMEYRRWAKANTSYYEPYLELMDKNNVIHANLKIHGTISGRLSCEHPNLQAVPRYKTELKVKDVFISRPGYTFISADYSQAEIRLGVHYAKETKMADLLRNGIDIHTRTAENLGIERSYAKRINFGIIYGIGAKGLSNDLNIPEAKAKKYLSLYHNEYPGFRELYNECDKMASSKGFIRMWTGRTRKYNRGHIKTPTHKAMSNLIQGGVAEIMRVAIIKLYDALSQYDAHMLIQIHDQIIFEVKDEQVKDVLPIVKKIMEDYDFSVPMRVDCSIGKCWGKLYDIKIEGGNIIWPEELQL